MSLVDFVYSRLNLTDAEIATAANTPNMSLKRLTLTAGFICGDKGLGLSRGGQIISNMKAAAAQNDLIALVLSVLSSTGVESNDAQLPDVIAQLIGAGICTQNDVNDLLYNISWPVAGRTGDVTENEVATARILAERMVRLDRMSEKMTAFQNEKINPAYVNINLEEPDLNTLISWMNN